MAILHIGLLICDGIGVETAVTLDWQARSNSVAGKVTIMDYLRVLFMFGYVKTYVLCVQIQCLSHMRERFKQANAAISTETLKSVENI